ncbi:AMP-binding enzyme [Zalerion maritima]|uniref:AMP-binding enzyme n=1 Tax=Zalerion maritima TaxID=339359 RepID=A0AAD5RHM6_9PEZI|nr:AMP-binding enzyme [Zalerion maritima]
MSSPGLFPEASNILSLALATSPRISPYLNVLPERQWITAVDSGSCFDIDSSSGNFGSVCFVAFLNIDPILSCVNNP